MKLSIDKNKVTIELPKSVRTKAQKHTLEMLFKRRSTHTALEYLKTFSTKPSRDADVNYLVRDAKPSMKNVYDVLSKKQRGSTLAAFKKMLDTSASHAPIGSATSWIGVEIECCIPYASLNLSGVSACQECSGSGVIFGEEEDGEEIEVDCAACNGSGEVDQADDVESQGRKALRDLVEVAKIKRVSIKSDGSIDADSDYMPIEFAILTKLDDTKNLEALCALLNKLGAVVNRSCGLHVHLDARHLSEEQVSERGLYLKRALPVLAAMVPKRRRENSYCKLQVSKTDRYSAINLVAFKKYGTIEVRLHSSTTNFTKIISWAKIIDAVSKSYIPRTVKSINELMDYARIEENLVEYMTQRTALFADVPEAVSIEFHDTDERAS